MGSRLHQSSAAYDVGSPLNAASSLFIWAGRLILLAVLLGAPWALGGVQYEHQRWIYSGILAALTLWVTALWVQPRAFRVAPPVVPSLLVPIVATLLLGGLQILPGLHSKLPRLNFVGREATDDAGGPSLGHLTPQLRDDLSQRSQISLYPASTRLELGKLTIGAAAFLGGLAFFTVPRLQRLLWLALALNGAALAIFGIVQKASWNGKIYWRIPLTHGGQPFASFVNRNNAAGYLNLCLAAAFGFAVWAFWKRTSVNPPGFGRMSRFGGALDPHALDPHALERPALERPASKRHSPVRFKLPQPQQILAILLCVVILAGVCASLSRGGTVAAVMAMLSILSLLAFQRGARVAVWSALGALVFCAALLSWLGLSGGFADRLSTLFDEHVTADARWMNWRTALRAVHDFPILGTGLGTYRYAYQPYQTYNAKLWFYNADNHYVEGLTEGGLVGLLLIGACILLVFRAVWLLIRRSAGGLNDPLVYVAVFALVSQCLQAGTDFGISVPSNLLTFATICGVVVGEAVRRCVPHTPPLSIALPVWQPRLVISILALALVLNGSLAVHEVFAATVAEKVRVGLPPLTRPDALSDSKLEAAIHSLEAAARRRPDDAELRQALGELWIYRFREQAYQFLAEQAAETPGMDLPGFGTIGLVPLHLMGNLALREANRQTLDELRKAPLVYENLRPARAHLLAARSACPLHPGIGLNLAATDFLDDVDPSGMANVERAVALAPVNDDVLFTAGVLAEHASMQKLTEQYWARNLSLGNRHLAQVLDAAEGKIPFAELVDRVLPPSPAILLDLARGRYSRGEHDRERQVLIQKSQALLAAGEPEVPDAQRWYWSGVAERLDGRTERAIGFYQQAVELQPETIEWRMELAQVFREAGRLDDAVREARLCLRMSPEMAGVEKLLDDLVREQSNKLREQ